MLQASAWPSPSHKQSCRSWPQVRKRFWKGCVHNPQSSSVWPYSRACAVTSAPPQQLFPSSSSEPLAPQPGSRGRSPGSDRPSATHSSWFPPAAQSPAPQQWLAQPQSVQESAEWWQNVRGPLASPLPLPDSTAVKRSPQPPGGPPTQAPTAPAGGHARRHSARSHLAGDTGQKWNLREHGPGPQSHRSLLAKSWVGQALGVQGSGEQEQSRPSQ